MPIKEELARLLPSKDTALTVGVFDGVHLGHYYLLSQLMEQAGRQNLLSGVVTFAPHPQKILSPENNLVFLTGLAGKKALLEKEGIETVIVLPFSRELARLSAREFVSLLKNYLRLKVLVVGAEATLGKNQEGNADALREMGRELGFTVIEVPPVTINGETVSSTAVRQALANGDLKKVRSLIGRPFSLSGRVSHGSGIGTKLDFPTANLEIDPEQAIPAEGVYATRADIGGRAYQSVTNIGRRPTFDNGRSMIEVHILDYKGDLYERELKIDIIERLRSEEKFDNAEALKKQIAGDVARSRDILKRDNGE